MNFSSLAIEAGAKIFATMKTIGKSSPRRIVSNQSRLRSKAAGITPQGCRSEMVPQNYIKLEGSQANQMVKLMEALEDHDDVQKVSANFDMSEADMAAA
jgi:transcriptional/translational regulatory protein YebC/TACO1